MAKKEELTEQIMEEQPEEMIEVKIPASSLRDPFSVADLPGVGAATALKLKESGYETVMAVAVATPGELVESAGVTEVVARKMINAARDNMDMGFQSGEELLKKRARVIRLKVGAEAFNNLLGGGFETGAITECFGEFGSGKTQIGHTLAVSCMKDDPTAVAVYIDTENTFRPDRIQQLSQAMGMEPEKVLANIKVARAYNSDHQMIMTEKVEDLITKQGLNVRLVVIDSLTAHFRAEFVGRGTLAERQQKLNKHMHTLMKLADTYNLAVYVTNQVMAKPDTFFGDPTAAIGGHIVAHASTFRIYLRKGKKGTRVAKLIDSPNMPEAECSFMVGTDGVKDVK